MATQTISKGRTVQAETVMIASSGNLRISHDLIPEKLKNKPLAFRVETFPAKQGGGRVVLSPMEQDNESDNHEVSSLRNGGYIVRAWKTTPTSKSPLISALAILSSLGLKPPKKSKVASARKLKTGDIEFDLV